GRRVPQPWPRRWALDGRGAGKPRRVQEHRGDRRAGRRELNSLEHRGVERSAHRVLRGWGGRRRLPALLRNRGEHALDPGVVDHHATLALAITLADSLPLRLRQLGLPVQLRSPQAPSGAGSCRLPRAIATLTAAAAAIGTTAPPAIACILRSSPSARIRAPTLDVPAIASADS